MARINQIDNASSQFFVNLNDNDFHDCKESSNYGHALFGRGRRISSRASTRAGPTCAHWSVAAITAF